MFSTSPSPPCGLAFLPAYEPHLDAAHVTVPDAGANPVVVIGVSLSPHGREQRPLRTLLFGQVSERYSRQSAASATDSNHIFCGVGCEEHCRGSP